MDTDPFEGDNICKLFEHDCCVLPVKLLRYTQPTGRTLTFSSTNVRSLSPPKLDDLLVEFEDHSLDVMLLCKTWHDATQFPFASCVCKVSVSLIVQILVVLIPR
jgi:hypothetical protein